VGPPPPRAVLGLDLPLRSLRAPARSKHGYYALPLLWRDQVIGLGNASVKEGRLSCELGFTGERPRDPSFERELAAEVARMGTFLGE
jgi:uncharacterized protein